MITCGYRSGIFILPLQALDTLFRQWSCNVTFTNYVVNLTVPFHWTFFFFSAIAFWSLGFDVTFSLCPLMIFDILLVQLQLTLTEFCEAYGFLGNVLLPIKGMS